MAVWQGDYCSSIKLTSFSFKWLAQLVNQLELEEVMEVARQKWKGQKTRDTNKRIRSRGKKKTDTRTHTHTQLGIVFPRLSLSGANTKGAGRAGGSGAKGAHQLNLMTICGRRRRKEALHKTKPNRNEPKAEQPYPAGRDRVDKFRCVIYMCVCVFVKLTTTQLNAAGHRHTQSGHSQASRVLIYI